jgi:hypothetical protein
MLDLPALGWECALGRSTSRLLGRTREEDDDDDDDEKEGPAAA